MSNKMETKFSGKRVLVVEDYFINQEIVQDMLELMDCQVELADNGKEALEKVAGNKYDLILMDVQLPEKDGYEVTKEIRRQEQSSGAERTAIVALTANAMTGDREKCLEAGMDDYMAKPIDINHLEGILKKHLPA